VPPLRVWSHTHPLKPHVSSESMPLSSQSLPAVHVGARSARDVKAQAWPRLFEGPRFSPRHRGEEGPKRPMPTNVAQDATGLANTSLAGTFESVCGKAALMKDLLRKSFINCRSNTPSERVTLRQDQRGLFSREKMKPG